MKNRLLNIVKIILSAITFPLWFVKIFTDIGHLPDQETGEIIKVVFRHSMYENICAIHPIFAYITMAIIIASIVLNAVEIKFDNKNLRIIGNIVFGVRSGCLLSCS